MLKRILIFALVASLVISPLDYLQVLFGIETAGVLWLVPLKFALVGGVLGLLAQWIDPKAHPAKIQAVSIHAAMFSMAYIFTLVFSSAQLLIQIGLTMVLLGLVLAQEVVSEEIQIVAHLEKRFSIWEVVPFMILLGFCGPLVEWIDVKMSGFKYLATPGTIPMWLPLLWMNGSYFTRALVGRTQGLA